MSMTDHKEMQSEPYGSTKAVLLLDSDAGSNLAGGRHDSLSLELVADGLLDCCTTVARENPGSSLARSTCRTAVAK